jgi:hypothetical protein
VVKKKKKRRKVAIRRRSGSKNFILDAFTENDLEEWGQRSVDVQAYLDRVYFDLERQRAVRHDDLRAVPAIEQPVDRWVRVTDWRWNLTPLSPAGSLNGIGGRFNIGRDLDRARGQAFPCLYIAADVETAYREYFGAPLDSRAGGLSLQELALRRQTSFTTFALEGALEHVFDLRSHHGLVDFAGIIGRFDVTSDTKKFARGAGIPARSLFSTPHELFKRMLAPPGDWRGEPQLFGIPAASQMFGRFVRDAGFEAILYQSQRGGRLCLAVFPENFRASDSRIKIVGDMPPGATCTQLDKNDQCMSGVLRS